MQIGEVVTRQEDQQREMFSGSMGRCSWQSKRQTATASSTLEAEYIAASEATKEALYLQNLLIGLGIARAPTPLPCDCCYVGTESGNSRPVKTHRHPTPYDTGES
jgi:hypothetical protein